jgi:ATP-dependent exoDNAse (exonuclease V) alpha subunit
MTDEMEGMEFDPFDLPDPGAGGQPLPRRDRSSTKGAFSRLTGADSQRDRTETRLKGMVTRIFKSSDAWSAGILQAADGPMWDRECSFTVKARVELDEVITLVGGWKENDRFGWQFVAAGLEYPMPDITADGLASYLSTTPAFVGIGPAKAQAIAKACYTDFDRLIREEPEKVQAAGKLTDEQIQTLQHEWCRRADLNAISSWLAGFGLTAKQIQKLAERYGNKARTVLQSDPYVLMFELDGFGFARTDEVALKIGATTDHPGRIRACLVDQVRQAADDGGHTWIERSDLVRKAVEKLGFVTAAQEGLIHSTLKAMIEDTGGDDSHWSDNLLYATDHPDTGKTLGIP